jgi:hypothetical protein
MQITIIKKILNEKQALALEACKKKMLKKPLKEESQEHQFIKNELAKKDINTIRIEKHPEACHVFVDKADKESAQKVLKHHGLDKEYKVKTNEAVSDKKRADNLYLKYQGHEHRDFPKSKWNADLKSGATKHTDYWDWLATHVKNESLDESVSKDYEAAAKLAKELTTYANSLKSGSQDYQYAHYKAFKAQFEAYDKAHTDPKHKEHLALADKHLHIADKDMDEMANSGYVSGLQKSVNTLQAHLKRHGLEHTFTQQHVNTTLKSLGHSAQITHHNGLNDIRKVTDNDYSAPSAAELIVRHMSIHGSKNESLDEGQMKSHPNLKGLIDYQSTLKDHGFKYYHNDFDGNNYFKHKTKPTVIVNVQDLSWKHKDASGNSIESLKTHLKESLDESELLTFHLKHKDNVENAIKGIGHSSFSDRDGHNIRYEKKDEPRIKQAIAKAGLVPTTEDKFKSSDNIRTTDFEKVQATAAKVKRRSDIKKAIARKLKNKKESEEDFESYMISESVDIDAVKKLSSAIKANPDIEEALFQLISAIMTNPKMFESNPSSVVNKIAAASKVPAAKLQSVVDALGIV